MTDEGNDDILSFWKENQNVFPSVASVAREILPMPASKPVSSVCFQHARAPSRKNNAIGFREVKQNHVSPKEYGRFEYRNSNQSTKYH